MLATWGCSTFPKPTLSLDFAGATSLDSGITFSRGSQATLFDSTGTLVYAKHNLFTYSDDFANAVWATNNATISSNVAIAPDGALTADKIVETATTGTHDMRRLGVSFTSGLSYVHSIYVKVSGRSLFLITFPSAAFGTNAAARFDLSAVTATVTTSGTNTTASITPVGNDWYRCVLRSDATATATGIVFWNLLQTTASNSYTGDGTSGVLIWGAQLNLANMEGGVTSSLTTYYPTTTAAYYAPRFDYNPSTLQPLGLLIEEARTNSLTYSEDFGNAAWGKSNSSITTDTTTSPANTVTADTLVENTATSSHLMWQTRSGSNETTTFTIFAKQSTRSRIKLEMSNFATASCGGYFDLAAGTVIAVDAANADYTNPSASITNVGNGWFRCSVTVTKGAVNTTNNPVVILVNTGTSVVYTGNGTSGVFLWGAQLEVGAFATSYIPTTTTALTRNADVASMTGTNFSSWYSASEGTLFAEFTASANANTVYAAISNGATNQNSIYFDNDSGLIRNVIFSSNSAQAAMSTGAIGTVGTVNKIAGAYKVNDFAVSRNGAAAVTDTAGNVPVSPSQLDIGRNPNAVATTYVSGYIRRLAFYPQRLANSQLQALTS